MLDRTGDLWRAHLETRLGGVAEDLEACGFDAVLISAGSPYIHFRDDQPAPFRANAHFLHFCPLEAPRHQLLLRPGKPPFLAAWCPDDFWYEPQRVGSPAWAADFEVVECRSRPGQAGEIARRLPAGGRTAFVGEDAAVAETFGLAANPGRLLDRMDWRRAVKTPYEVACIAEANRVAADGHRAAEAAFHDGGSEMEIHRAFVAAVGCEEAALPYPSIVGLDEKGAVLHYEGKRTDVRDARTLLIDAGARVRGYASDITRTRPGTRAGGRFRSLVAAMESAQQALCDGAHPGRPWAELHAEAHRSLAGVLREAGVIRVSPDEAVESGLSRVFFPHGLGHFLGIQVHDVGGHLAHRDGRRAEPPPEHPTLRTTRTLEPGHVITVEPGVYFIPMLLDPWREGARRRAVDWEAVEALLPFGGVRIEDDVLVTDGAPRNLTREHLPT